jgi:phosphatidate cytidylyltransferase
VADSLRQRVLTALLLAGLVIAALLGLPGHAAVAAIALVMLAGAWEWAVFAGLTSTAGRVGYVALVAVTIALLWTASDDGANLRAILVLAMLWWLAGLLWLLFASHRGGHVAAALAGLAVLAPAAVGLARLVLIEPQGRELLLFLIVLTAAADVGAFFGGRRFGRRKLAPAVSPGKTWEGLMSGMLAASLAAAGGAQLLGHPLLPWLGLCLGVAMISVVGDLVESMFKRRTGLKDSGSLLPGHGGVLDRIDSLTAAAPAFVLGLMTFGWAV